MELRTVVLTLGSFVLTSLVVSNAFYQKKQFYPSVVHLTKSNPSMAVIYIQALVFVVLMGKIVRKIFFGQLRAAELEHLIERSWYAVTETCLAFTVFRDDFSPKFVALFTLLLFVKCFHWLAEDRVDYMERSPVITLLFHVRMMGIVGLLSAVDSYFVSHAYFTTLLRGASVQLVFGFEYAILLTAVFMISTKYILHTMDLRNIHPWENKAVYLLYSELVLDFIRVVLYTVFMVVMMKLHTFPLFSVRPMYLTIRSFKKALHDVIMSRRAINYMNNVYPDATAEELHSGDNVCIICREEMVTAAKKLPCNHIFHTACLRSWFQRQQTCPTCRLDILQIPVRPQTQQQPQQPAAPPLPPPPHAHPHQFMAGVQAAPQPAIGGIPPPNAGFPPQFNMPPGMMPPFMPQMPFMLPFPTAPNFAGLTDDEVRRMEGNERQAIEQRVQCLRNIQTLLDAATVQLHQYLSIMTAITAAPQFAATIVPPTVPPPATTNNTTATPADTTGDEAANSSSVVFTAGESAFAATNGTEEEPNATEESQPSSSGGSAESSDIRQRRLEHFQTKLKTNSIPPPT